MSSCRVILREWNAIRQQTWGIGRSLCYRSTAEHGFRFLNLNRNRIEKSTSTWFAAITRISIPFFFSFRLPITIYSLFFIFNLLNERQQSQFHYTFSFLHLLFERECEYCDALRFQSIRCKYSMYGTSISLTGKRNGRKWYSHNVSLHITQLQEVKALSICLKLQNVITW